MSDYSRSFLSVLCHSGKTPGREKRPYKSELGFRFWAGTDRKAPRSSLFMRITPAFVGFGAGLTWAACLFDLGPLALEPGTEGAEEHHQPRPERAPERTPESVIDDRGVVEGLIA